MSKEQLLFLDLRFPQGQMETTASIPPYLGGDLIKNATLLTWNFEGQPEIPIGSDQRTTHFYAQIKFEGCLETRTNAYGARSDMFPLPLRSFTDWAPTTLPLPLFRGLSPMSTRFKVSLWGEGEAPAPFAAPATGVRLLLWIKLELS